jgi:hypothetical protein
VPFANEAYQFQRKLWENRDLTVGYFMQPASLIFQKPFCNMAKTELKVTQDLEKPFTIAIFPYTDSWCLVPFSSNVSLDRKQKSIYCFGCGLQRYGLQSRKGA